MQTELWMVGKTRFAYLDEGVGLYEKRLQHYLSFQMRVIPDLKNSKNLSMAQIKEKEGKEILRLLDKGHHLVLLDERGKSMSSTGFASFMERSLQGSHKRLVFLIGGAYGFSEAVYQRANAKLSLSSMTFSHQMVRLFFIEQLYRAMTILRNEPYHHDG
ncbi:MAG: 23S rRNA (pseudouridine(1915)-N(3))-methyltransferase RlmH [Bacteroidota bacterium]